MEPWELWYEMAQEAFTSGQLLLEQNKVRSSISRFYYATYQMVTAFLLSQNLPTPVDREAWSHTSTPELLQEQLKRIPSQRSVASRLRSILGLLYKMRVDADYHGNREIKPADALVAKKLSGRLCKVIETLLPIH